MGGSGKGMPTGGDGEEVGAVRGGVTMSGPGDVGVVALNAGGGGGGGKSCVVAGYGWAVADVRNAWEMGP